MRLFVYVLLAGLAACGERADQAPRPVRSESPALPMAAPVSGQSAVAGKIAPGKAALLEVPADKQQLERLVALGYSVHDEHLHPPGAKECPLAMGGGVVQ